jgi:DNA-binding transcriptional LysR family regulator
MKTPARTSDSPVTTSASVLLNRLQAKARMRHLQVLVKLGELQSFKRCAEALGLSQPAVTQLLADLERLVELPLFERHSRGARITPAGRELLPLARRMLDALAEGTETLTALKHQGEGVVRVAAITGALAGLLVRAVPAFARAHPAVQLQVRESDVDQCALQLARGEVDIVACRQPAAPPAGCRFRPLLEDRFVVACGPAHPLADRRELHWPVLLRQSWLPSPVGSAARQVFDRLMSEAGASLPMYPVITRVSSLTWALLRAEPLLTLVPYGVVRQLVEAGQLAVIEPLPALPFSPLGLLLPEPGATVATRTFADFVEAYARDVLGSAL